MIALRSAVGPLAACSSLFLPGAWISFGLALNGATTAIRLVLAVVLSPLVLALQFYAFVYAGASVDHAIPLIALLNVAVLILIWRRRVRPVRGHLLSVVDLGAAFLLPLSYLLLWMGDAQKRAAYGHAWIHTDIVYQLGRGALRPEEPLFAGVRLAYPWLSHVEMLVVSYLSDTPPNAAYLWVNLTWLFAMVALASALTAQFHGGRFSRILSSVWLCFGLGTISLVMLNVFPALATALPPIFQEPRFIPWFRKFGIFEPTMFGIGLFAALLYVASRAPELGERADWEKVSALLLISIGLIYPILFPAALAVLAARGVALLGLLRNEGFPRLRRLFAWMLGSVLVI